MCGSDIKLPKVKNKEDIPKAQKRFLKETLEWRKNKSIVIEPTKVMMNDHPNHLWRHHLQVIWDIGRRCNFSCSYCFPNSHNNYEAHKTYGSLMHGFDMLEKNFLLDRKCKFIFTGGEPTMNPNYLEFIKKLREKGHISHTTTNGSRTKEYYEELLKNSSIGFSIHFDHINDDLIIETISHLCKVKKQWGRSNWMGIRIMVPPQYILRAKEFFNKIKLIDNIDLVSITLGAIHQLNMLDLAEYKEEDLKWIQENSI